MKTFPRLNCCRAKAKLKFSVRKFSCLYIEQVNAFVKPFQEHTNSKPKNWPETHEGNISPNLSSAFNSLPTQFYDTCREKEQNRFSFLISTPQHTKQPFRQVKILFIGKFLKSNNPLNGFIIKLSKTHDFRSIWRNLL